MNNALNTTATEIEEKLEKLCDQLGTTTVKELIDQSLKYLEAIKQELSASLAAEDWASVSRQAHQLKGASVIFWSSSLSALVAKLQTKPAPIESGQTLLDELHRVLAEIREIILSKQLG